MLLPVSDIMSEEKNIDDIKHDLQILKEKIDIRKSGKARLSLILGIIGLSIFFIGFTFFIELIFG